MKTCLKNCWAWMFIAIAIAMPGAASAQSICEGLTTILTADYDELQFYTVPGAICRYESWNGFGCIWQKPEPLRGKGKARDWLNTTIYPDMKKLAGAIQQCIKQEAIPFEWDSFEEEYYSNGYLRSYFVQRVDGRSTRKGVDTISVCHKIDSDGGGPGVVLNVRTAPEGKSYCSTFW